MRNAELIKGRKILRKIINIHELTRQGAENALWHTADELKRKTSKDILKKPKSGRTYFWFDKAGRRRKHVASAPWETHANFTGALRRSLGYVVRSHSQLEFGYGVEAGQEAPDYAHFVEFGTRKMKPRPSIRNNIKSARKLIIKNIEREILKGLK